MLDAAGYGVQDGSDGIMEFDGLIALASIDGTGNYFPLSIAIYAHGTNDLKWPGMVIRYKGSNIIFSAENGVRPAPLLIANSMKAVGMQSAWGVRRKLSEVWRMGSFHSQEIYMLSRNCWRMSLGDRNLCRGRPIVDSDSFS
jgi:hypothetical protein